MPFGVQGSGPGCIEHQPAEVHRVQAVGVLGRVDQLQDPAARRCPWAAGAGRCSRCRRGPRSVRRRRASISSWVAVAGSSRWMRGDADLGAVAVLPLTYEWLPGSSPTSTVPRPGVTPRSRSASTRALRSDLIAAAVALPSRICAVMAYPPRSRRTVPVPRRAVPGPSLAPPVDPPCRASACTTQGLGRLHRGDTTDTGRPSVIDDEPHESAGSLEGTAYVSASARP